MLSHIKRVAFASAATAMLAGAAYAAPVTFFAEDLNPGSSVTATVAAKQSEFLSNFTGVGTEDFEGLAGSAPLNLTFPGTAGNLTATLNGSADINSSPGAGRFATSGSNYVETAGGGDFSISFGTAISAFGFYGTDIGDFNNELVLRMTKSSGGTVDLSVGNTVGAANGSLLFFGFIDTGETYTNIAFLNQPGGTDVFGFDDMIIGDRGQITIPNPIPLPAAGWLMIAGLGGIAAMRRKS